MRSSSTRSSGSNPPAYSSEGTCSPTRFSTGASDAAGTRRLHQRVRRLAASRAQEETRRSVPRAFRHSRKRRSESGRDLLRGTRARGAVAVRPQQAGRSSPVSACTATRAFLPRLSPTRIGNATTSRATCRPVASSPEEGWRTQEIEPNVVKYATIKEDIERLVGERPARESDLSLSHAAPRHRARPRGARRQDDRRRPTGYSRREHRRPAVHRSRASRFSRCTVTSTSRHA